MALGVHIQAEIFLLKYCINWFCCCCFGCTCSMWKNLRQGSNLDHSNDKAKPLITRPLGKSKIFTTNCYELEEPKKLKGKWQLRQVVTGQLPDLPPQGLRNQGKRLESLIFRSWGWGL